MAKYATLKIERDDAVARALEAERLSNKAVVDDLEQRLAEVTCERDAAREVAACLRQKLLEYNRALHTVHGRLLMEQIKVLDHGYVQLVECWGSDQSIIEAARMSTGKGFLGWGSRCKKCKRTLGGDSNWSVCPNEECEDAGAEPGDEKLLRYLWEHEHATPFEMAGLTIEVKAPIMVFREWHRHRVPFGYNEMSARYVPLPDENYSPTVQRIVEGSRSTKNKQAASLAGECSDDNALEWLGELALVYAAAERVYQRGLQLGVPKELARLPVPVGRYSRMRATGNLRGWLGFCRLRAAPNAQYEIRVYAYEVLNLIARKFPRTHALFMEGKA